MCCKLCSEERAPKLAPPFHQGSPHICLTLHRATCSATICLSASIPITAPVLPKISAGIFDWIVGNWNMSSFLWSLHTLKLVKSRIILYEKTCQCKWCSVLGRIEHIDIFSDIKLHEMASAVHYSVVDWMVEKIVVCKCKVIPTFNLEEARLHTLICLWWWSWWAWGSWWSWWWQRSWIFIMMMTIMVNIVIVIMKNLHWRWWWWGL